MATKESNGMIVLIPNPDGTDFYVCPSNVVAVNTGSEDFERHTNIWVIGSNEPFRTSLDIQTVLDLLGFEVKEG